MQGFISLAQAFSHWTWQASKNKLMVVDAQVFVC